MGLIQTVDQLKFSYMAIVEGAKQLGVIPQDALSDLVGPKPPPPRNSDPETSSSSDGEAELIEDEESDEDIAPPLPPKRSESLLKSNVYSNGLDSLANMPDFLQGINS